MSAQPTMARRALHTDMWADIDMLEHMLAIAKEALDGFSTEGLDAHRADLLDRVGCVLRLAETAATSIAIAAGARDPMQPPQKPDGDAP